MHWKCTIPFVIAIAAATVISDSRGLAIQGLSLQARNFDHALARRSPGKGKAKERKDRQNKTPTASSSASPSKTENRAVDSKKRGPEGSSSPPRGKPLTQPSAPIERGSAAGPSRTSPKGFEAENPAGPKNRGVRGRPPGPDI